MLHSCTTLMLAKCFAHVVQSFPFTTGRAVASCAMEHEARPRSTCWSVDEARVADYIAEMRKVFNSLEGSCAKLLEEHEAQLRTQLFQLLALTPWSDVEWVLDSDKGELQAQRIVSFSPVRTEHSIVALDVPCEPSDSNMHDGLPPPLAPTRSESPMTSGRSGINIGATPSKSGFKLLNDWMLLHEGSASSLDSMEDTVQGMSAKYASRLNRLLDRGGGSSENVVAAVTRSRCVFRPATKPKIAWDLIAAALLAYDLVMIPMGIFSIPRTLRHARSCVRHVGGWSEFGVCRHDHMGLAALANIFGEGEAREKN
eukprot:4278697-Amphidinium_carterae.1